MRTTQTESSSGHQKVCYLRCPDFGKLLQSFKHFLFLEAIVKTVFYIQRSSPGFYFGITKPFVHLLILFDLNLYIFFMAIRLTNQIKSIVDLINQTQTYIMKLFLCSSRIIHLLHNNIFVIWLDK